MIAGADAGYLSAWWHRLRIQPWSATWWPARGRAFHRGLHRDAALPPNSPRCVIHADFGRRIAFLLKDLIVSRASRPGAIRPDRHITLSASALAACWWSWQAGLVSASLRSPAPSHGSALQDHHISTERAACGRLAVVKPSS